MAFCTAQQRVMLFGGEAGGTPVGDTWEWDGVNWQLRLPSVSPSPRARAALAYDVQRQRALLFGGYVNGSQYAFNDTWEWDGTNWLQQVPALSPAPTKDGCAAYDPTLQRVVLQGGRSNSPETWEWDGTNWTLFGPDSPTGAVGPGVYDSARHRTVLFGHGAQTWEWDGTRWALFTPAVRPAARGEHALAYDPNGQNVVLFGGRDWPGPTLFGDTWTWDGVAWTQRNPAAAPTPRSRHAMVFDPARQRVLLYGGADSSGYLAETWEWDGASWLLRQVVSPPARGGHAMAYDAGSQRVVLFGGGSGGTLWQRSDTWEWDGIAWAQRFPANQPSARYGHAMAWDGAGQRVLLFGGGQSGYDDLWEWNLTNWSQVVTATTLPRSWGEHALVHDEARQNMILLLGPPVRQGETWLLEPVPAAPVDFGTGCAAAHAAPRLAVGEPFPGNPLFTIDLLTTTPNALCAIGVADQRANLPIGGGCSLLLQGTSGILFGFTNAGGFASVHFAVAQIPALRGYAIHAQGFVLDPPGAVLDIAFSAGKTFLIGH